MTVVHILIQALLSFAFLATATFGIVLIFKTSATTNFAQGMIGILGAYLTSYLIDSVGKNDYTGLPSVTPIPMGLQIVLPILGGMLLSFLFGLLVDAIIFRNSRYSNPVSKQIITMGLVIAIIGIIPVVFGSVERFSFKFTQDSVDILGVSYQKHSLITLGIATIILTTLFVLLRKTKWGLAVRSVASNEEVAGLMGINTKRISAMSWAIAGALGALSAITYTASKSTLGIMDMANMQIYAFYAAIIGGFATFGGPIVGAFIFYFVRFSVGPVLNLITNFSYKQGWNWRLYRFENIVVYLIVMLIILIKPNGIFGKKTQKKV